MLQNEIRQRTEESLPTKDTKTANRTNYLNKMVKGLSLIQESYEGLNGVISKLLLTFGSENENQLLKQILTLLSESVEWEALLKRKGYKSLKKLEKGYDTLVTEKEKLKGDIDWINKRLGCNNIHNSKQKLDKLIRTTNSPDPWKQLLTPESHWIVGLKETQVRLIKLHLKDINAKLQTANQEVEDIQRLRKESPTFEEFRVTVLPITNPSVALKSQEEKIKQDRKDTHRMIVDYLHEKGLAFVLPEHFSQNHKGLVFTGETITPWLDKWEKDIDYIDRNYLQAQRELLSCLEDL